MIMIISISISIVNLTIITLLFFIELSGKMGLMFSASTGFCAPTFFLWGSGFELGLVSFSRCLQTTRFG